MMTPVESSNTLPASLARREALATGGKAGLLSLLLAAGFARPQDVFAQSAPAGVLVPAEAFNAKGIPATLKALGATGSAESRDIRIEAPDVSETGGQVPVIITSNIPRTESIAILIENNPHALSSVFQVPSWTDPYLSLNVKMQESTQLYALVRSGGKYFHARQMVRVTIGGCGQ
jgi:sulfur-oxidizing protein SoxY